GLLARRVEQADQAEEDEVSRQVGGTEAARLQAGIFEPSERQHALALAGELVGGAPKVCPIDPLPLPPRGLLPGAKLPGYLRARPSRTGAPCRPRICAASP